MEHMESCPWKEISLNLCTVKRKKQCFYERKQGEEAWMEACPDAHPMLTSCLGPFGISGTSCFWTTHREDRRSHRQLGVGVRQPGLCAGARSR